MFVFYIKSVKWSMFFVDVSKMGNKLYLYNTWIYVYMEMEILTLNTLGHEHFSGDLISISVPAFTTPSCMMFSVVDIHWFSCDVGIYVATSIEILVPRGQLNVIGSWSQPVLV